MTALDPPRPPQAGAGPYGRSVPRRRGARTGGSATVPEVAR